MPTINYLNEFFVNPRRFIQAGFDKVIVGPIKYHSKNGYNNKRYWEDRFKKYGFQNFTSTGNEGLSKQENQDQYRQQASIFEALIKKNIPDIKKQKFLEVGVGNGFYTGIMLKLKVGNYLGSDITDVFFPNLKEKFPQYSFTKLDICGNPLNEKFDVILMMDVIEHIVSESNLTKAMDNLEKMLNSKGILIFSGFYMSSQSNKEFFYEMKWSYKDIDKKLNKLTAISDPIPYRNDNLVFYKRK